MEITEINILGDFGALQNPSLISRYFSISSIEKVNQMYSFWKWGALILAIVATFSSLMKRIKLLIIRFRTVKSLTSSSSQPLLPQLEDDIDYSEDETSSPAAASEDDEEFESTSPFEERKPVDEDFRVAGSNCYCEDKWQYGNLKLRRRRSFCERFSWSDFAAGKSVVKLWDSLGLGLDFETSCRSEISIWDLDKDLKISSFFGGRSQIPALVMSSPTVVLSAGVNNSNSVVLGAYDTRVGRQIPEICAEWRLRQGNVVGIGSGGGVGKVYVKEGLGGALTVRDMRNLKGPLHNSAESDGDSS